MYVAKRIAACFAALALLGLAACSADALTAVSLDDCRGQLGVSVQWQGGQVSIACTDPAEGRTPIETLGLIVRWSDDSVSTVGLGAQTTSTDTSRSSYSSSSHSSSMSSSTTCINGQCSTTTSSVGCDDNDCWGAD